MPAIRPGIDQLNILLQGRNRFEEDIDSFFCVDSTQVQNKPSRSNRGPRPRRIAGKKRFVRNRRRDEMDSLLWNTMTREPFDIAPGGDKNGIHASEGWEANESIVDGSKHPCARGPVDHPHPVVKRKNDGGSRICAYHSVVRPNGVTVEMNQVGSLEIGTKPCSKVATSNDWSRAPDFDSIDAV